ncbi:MAG: portal protein [Rhodospirillales bacterium]
MAMPTNPEHAYESIKRTRDRLEALRTKRSSWVETWRDISEHFVPRNGQFTFSRDANRGSRKDRKILNNTGTLAVRACSAGFHSGMSSPGKPWFTLSTSNRKHMKSVRVRQYLRDIEDLIRATLSASNIYRVLPQVYTECPTFGTAVVLMDKNLRHAGRASMDLADVVQFTMLAIGTYYIGVDARGRLAVVVREFEQTVDQIVEAYGYDACSDSVKTAYDSGRFEQMVPLIHAIEPRRTRDPNSPLASDMQFRSVVFEHGCNDGRKLLDSGFRSMPAFAARWDVLVEDVYGSGPGMDALGDARELQEKEVMLGKAEAQMSDPAIVVPAALKQGADFLPGGVSYMTMTSQHDRTQNAVDIQINQQHMYAGIDRIQRRIEKAFFVDLFRMLENDTRSNVTAREIAERHEEKLLAVGPVVERVENEVLRVIVDFTFEALVERDEMRVRMGLEPSLPEPPAELEDEPLDIEFTGMLSQAVKAAEAARLDRFIGIVGAAAALDPSALDAVSITAYLDAYSRLMNIPPEVMTDDVRRRVLAEARSKQMAAQAQAQQAKTASEAARNMAAASPAAATDVASAAAVANAIN